MIEIYINTLHDSNTDYLYPDEWKNYVDADFDNHVVLTGNPKFMNYINAEWYQKAKNILDILDDPWMCIEEIYNELSGMFDKETIKKIANELISIEDSLLYKNDFEDNMIMSVLKLIYPNDTFAIGTIKGYSQSEWQKYIIINNTVDIATLTSYYFNQLISIDIHYTSDDYVENAVITDDELWTWSNNNELELSLRKRFDIADSEQIKIFKSSGTHTVIDWKEIEGDNNE